MTNTLETPDEERQHLNLAVAACERGDHMTARNHFAAARQQKLERCEDALSLGFVALNVGEGTEALDCFTTAVKLEPARALTHSSRALALQLLERSAEAKPEAEAALDLDPNEPVALKVLARISLNARCFADAQVYCRRILDANPEDADARTMLLQCGSPPPAAPLNSRPASVSVAAPAPSSDQEIKQILGTLLAEAGFRRLQQLGFHLQRNDFYSPLNDCDFLEANPDLWTPLEMPADIDWRLDDQFKLAQQLARFLPELRDVPERPPEDCSAYGWKNNFWENADALVQYGLVRLLRPARYVEIGCGWSSLLLKQALARNVVEGSSTDVTLIEPYPNNRIFRHFPAAWKTHRAILQRAPLEVFDQLQAGDVVFYDGSHCSKIASDVNWFFFKILPRLKPGVIIHIHDIALPQEYPRAWIFERGQTWNEQFVLQAFLMHNSAYKILIANRYLSLQRPKELKALYGNHQPIYGSSFWLQKLPAAASRGATGQSDPGWAAAGAAPVTATASRAAQTPAAPAVSEKLHQIEGLMGDYAARCAAWENLGVEHLLQQLVVGDFKKAVEFYPAPAPAPAGNDGFPVPPASLTMGYGAGNLDHYLACGRKTYQILTGLLQTHQVTLDAGDAILDWGGAAGRVVRQFVAEARRGCEVWGCDVHAPSIQWAQSHLSPPFKFFNSSSLPHLPFPDGTFKFIYGMSVMTHLVALRDLWLLELRRVLRPDGCLILTVHNEHTWDWFREKGMPAWMPKELCDQPRLPGEYLEIRGSRWEYVYTFFHSQYLRRVWGQFLDVRDVVPCADLYQAAVVMKKLPPGPAVQTQLP